MKKFKYGAFKYFLSLIFLFSCSQGSLDNIDTNPNSPTDVQIDLLIPEVTASLATQTYGGGIPQYLSLYVEHSTNVHLNERRPQDRNSGYWNSNYQTITDLKIIIEKGTEENKWTHVGIAKVIYAFILGAQTDVFGDIPHTEAVQGSEIRAPKFDSQESIYSVLQDMLDEAIDDLEKTAISNPGTNDMLLNGDVEMWIKTAWALKARYYNRLSNINPEQSANNALEALDNAYSDESEGLIFDKYTEGSINRNPFTDWERNEHGYAVSTTIIEVINSFNSSDYSDARAERWFTKQEGEFVGAPPGENEIDNNNPKQVYSGISWENVLTENALQPIITYVEMKFIEAEALFRLENQEEAYLAYQYAVEAACESAGLSDSEINEYTSQGTVFPGENSLTLEDIIKQKYIFYWFMQPLEAFNDWRRTDIPDLNHPEGTLIRIPYPDEEISRNPNAPTNIDNVTMYTIPVWWDEN